MTSKPPCARCGEIAETYNFEAETTFWGFATRETQIETTRRIRIFSTYYRRSDRYGNSRVIKSDETEALCADCWGDLVVFMQGRKESIPAYRTRATEVDR